MQAWNDSNDMLLLAEALATRLCHDLSGNLNAVIGAVEMMRHDPDLADEALDVAGDAATALVRRVQMVRAAWGPDGGAVGVDELHMLMDGMFGRRIRVDLSGLAGSASFAPSAARLTLNVILLAAESLPAGGVVEVVGDPARDLMVIINGPRAAWPSGFAQMLTDPARARNGLRTADGLAAARSVQGPLTALIAHAAGLRLALLLAPATEAAPPLLVTLTPLH